MRASPAYIYIYIYILICIYIAIIIGIIGINIYLYIAIIVIIIWLYQDGEPCNSNHRFAGQNSPLSPCVFCSPSCWLPPIITHLVAGSIPMAC